MHVGRGPPAGLHRDQAQALGVLARRERRQVGRRERDGLVGIRAALGRQLIGSGEALLVRDHGAHTVPVARGARTIQTYPFALVESVRGFSTSTLLAKPSAVGAYVGTVVAAAAADA